jgi:myo-inositol-1(or 4)-monophosphatase
MTGSSADERELLDVAREAADAAATELRARFGEHAHGVRAKSTPTDLVSDADVAAESAIREVLSARRPGDAILAEESGASGDGALRWVVDPLDGTINFLFGIPAFAVSVACEDSEGALAGVVLDPVREEWFAATRSGEALLGGQPIHGRGGKDLSHAMVATGFAYDAAVRARQADVLARVLPRVADVRRVGAAALDLAWCACGRFDAYYERGLHPWDVAAGALIAERAGLVVRPLAEAGSDPAGVVAAPPALIDELYELVVGPG